MSDIRVWIADLVDIHPADPELSMIMTNQPVVSKLDHDAAMKVLRDDNQRLKGLVRAFRPALQQVLDALDAAMQERLPEVSDGGSMEPLCGMYHEWEDLLHRAALHD